MTRAVYGLTSQEAQDLYNSYLGGMKWVKTEEFVADLITRREHALREQIAQEIEATLLPLCETYSTEGGYDCCGCSTYHQIAKDAAQIARGER